MGFKRDEQDAAAGENMGKDGVQVLESFGQCERGFNVIFLEQ